MDGFDPTTYGERTADEYDRLVTLNPGVAPADVVVDGLLRLADGRGPILELAIGTGRIALPLAARGVDVHGVDASPAMVAKLREKPGGADIPVTMGDFADVPVEGRYPVIFVAFNTFFALLTEEAQRRCFANVAGHLTDDGAFAVEGFVFDGALYNERNQRITITHLGLDEVKLDAVVHDPENQRIDAQQILLSAQGVRLFPVALRYVHPWQLDEMAAAAGLTLRERWGGWDGAPFTDASRSSVSVYVRSP